MMRLLVLVRRPRAAPDGEPAAKLLGVCDAAALRAALALHGRRADANVTVATVGPAEREDATLDHALDRGADRAVRVWDPGLEGVDYHGVAQVLAAAARWLGFDLILGGDRSDDEGGGAVGPAVAEALAVPHVTSTLDVSLAGATALVTRRDAGYLRALRVPLPALVTVLASPAPEPAATGGRGTIEVLALETLGIRAPELRARLSCLGAAEAAPRPAANVLAHPAELIARLRHDRLLEP